MKWRFYLRQILRQLWVRVSLYGLGGVMVAFLAWLLRDMLPAGGKLDAGAVDDLLTIIASSMLAVTTFSISTMISAYASAASSATPRATSLLLADTTAQSALATFIGAFIFSIVGIIALRFGVYGDSGRLLLFIATIVVLAAIVLTLIRWIDHVSTMGRLGTVVETIEVAARQSIAEWINPASGRPAEWDGKAGRNWVPLLHPDIGYVQHVAFDELQALAADHGCRIYIACHAGKLNDAANPLAFSDMKLSDELSDKLRQCFAIGMSRSFDQDPRFGLVTLTEVASRALSPAVNDPGTAIDVISRLYRLLAIVVTAERKTGVGYDRVHIVPLPLEDMLDDAFLPLARDGASLVEIGIRLMKAYGSLASLAKGEDRKDVLAHAKRSAARFTSSLQAPEDKAAVKALLPNP